MELQDDVARAGTASWANEDAKQVGRLNGRVVGDHETSSKMLNGASEAAPTTGCIMRYGSHRFGCCNITAHVLIQIVVHCIRIGLLLAFATLTALAALLFASLSSS